MERGVRLIGCGQAPVHKCESRTRCLGTRRLTLATDWEELLEMVENGSADPTIVLTHRFELEDIAKAYHLQEKREAGLVKCFVQTRFSSPRAEGTPELTHL